MDISFSSNISSYSSCPAFGWKSSRLQRKQRRGKNIDILESRKEIGRYAGRYSARTESSEQSTRPRASLPGRRRLLRVSPGGAFISSWISLMVITDFLVASRRAQLHVITPQERVEARRPWLPKPVLAGSSLTPPVDAHRSPLPLPRPLPSCRRRPRSQGIRNGVRVFFRHLLFQSERRWRRRNAYVYVLISWYTAPRTGPVALIARDIGEIKGSLVNKPKWIMLRRQGENVVIA